jgi:hypothetical protein
VLPERRVSTLCFANISEQTRECYRSGVRAGEPDGVSDQTTCPTRGRASRHGLGADAQLLSDCGSSEVTISDAGKRLHARILGANIDVTKRLWGDLPAEDLATTARVLAAVLERADLELARGSSAVPLGGSLEAQSSQRPAR